MPQLILTTKKGKEIAFAFKNDFTLADALNRIREVLIEKDSVGIDLTYEDLLGKVRTLIITKQFLWQVTISTL